MLKTILTWKKHPKDVRFVKFEHYKSQESSKMRGVFSANREAHKPTQLIPPFSPNAMLMDLDYRKTNLSASVASSAPTIVDSPILVAEEIPQDSVYDKKAFPFATVRPCVSSANGASSIITPAKIEPLDSAVFQTIPSYPVEYADSESHITVKKAKRLNRPFIKKNQSFKRARPLTRSANCELTKSLGIFSDTKMYSALIQSELQPYELNIQHFNHPNSFTRNKYPLFDNVSAWIIYLSEKGSDEFLERFIERYFEKPTLFLFAKTKRITTTQKLKTFILDNDLVTNKYLYEDI